jgi:hypothetical protein
MKKVSKEMRAFIKRILKDKKFIKTLADECFRIISLSPAEVRKEYNKMKRRKR